jgi:hypothetical protein
MAVTSRDLQKQPTRKTTPVAPVRWPQVQANRQYIQLGIALVLGFIVLHLFVNRGQTWIDDLRYGRPRTMQLSAYVGHNEQAGQPSHFVAMNLNRRVIVVELPGGDSAKAQTLQGPYLFGANENLTPVTLRVNDLNGDQKGDLVIAVKNEEIIYINSGDSFRLITDDERRQIAEVRP